MGDVIVLHNSPVDLESAEARSFVLDCCRAAEGLIPDDQVRDKYGLSPEAWRNSTKNRALVRAVQDERDRRIHNGAAAREAAARHFVKAPTILDKIMTNELASPRHQIEAIKELRATAAGSSPDGLPASERFVIRIDLTADGGGTVETYDKPRAPMKTINNREEDDGEYLG